MFARKFKLPVELLAVVNVAGFIISTKQVVQLDELVETAAHKTQAYLKGVAERFVDSKISRVVDRGEPADTIVENATVDTHDYPWLFRIKALVVRQCGG